MRTQPVAPLPASLGMRTGIVAAALLSCACVSSIERERAALLEYLHSEFRPDAPGGVVLVARGDDLLVHRAFGLADLESGRSMAVDDALPIGSVTKSFTAGAILRLVDEGALRLEDDVRLHVPEAPTAGRVVTLAQLLSNTSGMPNFVDRPDFEEFARAERSTAELVEQTIGMEWLFEPGTAFHYSDSGYILLGAVVERVSGLAYHEFIVQELARPLDMTRTRKAHGPSGPGPKGYSGGELAEPIHMSVAHAAGQLASSVEDLWTWVRAWPQGDVVSRPLADRAWSGHRLPDGTRSSYGYGWKRDTLEGRVMIGHGGWIPGFTAGLVHLPEERLTAIALVNTDDGDPEASYVARRSLRLLLTGSPHVQTLRLDPADGARLVGRYRAADGGLLSIDDPGTGACLTATWNGGSDSVRLLPLSASTFAVEDSDGTWLFTFDGLEEGPATTLRTSLSGEPRVLARRVPQSREGG